MGSLSLTPHARTDAPILCPSSVYPLQIQGNNNKGNGNQGDGNQGNFNTVREEKERRMEWNGGWKWMWVEKARGDTRLT